ncbi:hypothetical protein HDU97_001157 [Phlyctochytrium planicorne]|nr:hypothetical protein HDU97_001157 [Phlyctochytrium planicorne]
MFFEAPDFGFGWLGGRCGSGTGELHAASMEEAPVVLQMSLCCLQDSLPTELIQAAKTHRTFIQHSGSKQYWSQKTSTQHNRKRRWPSGSYYIASRVCADAQGLATLTGGQTYLHVTESALNRPTLSKLSDAFDSDDDLIDDDDEDFDLDSSFDLSSSTCSSASSFTSFPFTSSLSLCHDKPHDNDTLCKTGLFLLKPIPCIYAMDPSSLPNTHDEFAVWMASESLQKNTEQIHQSGPENIQTCLEQYHWCPRYEPRVCECQIFKWKVESLFRELLCEVIRRQLRKALYFPPFLASTPRISVTSRTATTKVPLPVARMLRQTVNEAVEVITLAEFTTAESSHLPAFQQIPACDEHQEPGRGRADSGVGDLIDGTDDNDQDQYSDDSIENHSLRARSGSSASAARGRDRPYPERKERCLPPLPPPKPIFRENLDIQNYAQSILQQLGMTYST